MTAGGMRGDNFFRTRIFFFSPADRAAVFSPLSAISVSLSEAGERQYF